MEKWKQIMSVHVTLSFLFLYPFTFSPLNGVSHLFTFSTFHFFTFPCPKKGPTAVELDQSPRITTKDCTKGVAPYPTLAYSVKRNWNWNVSSHRLIVYKTHEAASKNTCRLGLCCIWTKTLCGGGWLTKCMKRRGRTWRLCLCCIWTKTLCGRGGSQNAQSGEEERGD